MVAYINSLYPSPYDVAEPLLLSLDARSRAFKELLGDTIDQQEEYPYGLLSDVSTQHLNTMNGLAFLLWISLRREHPAIDLVQVHEILQSAKRIQVDRIKRILWADDPMVHLMNFIPAARKESDGIREENDWRSLWYKYSTTCRNGPPFEELTLTQLGVFLHQGELPDASSMSGPADSFDFERDNKIREFFQ
ncbi:hypothetical protein TA3x_004278 [Tundrisphaera sp. TA3]|uniref:hypothetical protein n=1 Tax=Tundrisphaera sp. TA3 TaxID=3435775 RepID=UPI003EBA13BE